MQGEEGAVPPARKGESGDKKIHWWNRIGNLSQIVSAMSAVCFGIGSVLIAVNVYQLQQRQRLDNALGRTSQLLGKYIDVVNAGPAFRRGDYCIAYLEAAVRKVPNFDQVVKSQDEISTFGENVVNPKYVCSEDRILLDKCLADLQSGEAPSEATRHDRFQDHLKIPLNTLEMVLFEWRNLPSEAKNEIAREIQFDACGYPIETLLRTGQSSEIVRRMFETDYQVLADFIMQICPKQPKPMEDARSCSAAGDAR
jgi:hypothetical protein